MFNGIRDKLNYRKSFYWCETVDKSKEVDLVGFISTEYMKQSKKKNIFWCGNIANGEKFIQPKKATYFQWYFLDV